MKEMFHGDYTVIMRKSPLSGRINTMKVLLTEEQYNQWKEGGVLIQDAMGHLSPDVREFIKTGITAEEWTKTFGDK